ncbi:neugrin [Poeciliopsis prolifica]|uniref:neugrin n=1 Tax=Poeciliopsis prolifica TaxID=188132 RepID=UPI0024138D5A|nr:neugrin [Poeciliopsis prolifica]
MARPLQVCRLLFKFSAPSLASPVYLDAVRFSSRDSSIKVWVGQNHVSGDRTGPKTSRFSDDVEPELEGLEDKLQAVLDKEKKRQRSVKFDKIRRKMAPPGAPERKLTWDAIEQIRYLKQEEPEEWTIERLAEGFSVPQDVILRVLKSKFTPSPNRKVKQDAKLMVRLGQQALPSHSRRQENKLMLPESQTPATLVPRQTKGALISETAPAQVLQCKGSASLVPVQPAQLPAGTYKEAGVKGSTVDGDGFSTKETEEDEEWEESWDGEVLTEEDLEEILDMDKPAPVVQVGNDFFDAEGNFLYRT